MQNRILNHYSKSKPPKALIPASFWYSINEECWVMCSERIPPLSTEFRDALVDRFCPEEVKQGVKEKDTVCIARLYLGRRHSGRPSRFFSLNNYVLCLDSMEQLELPVHEYAEAIADTLATLHWDAEIDANDVEFVLGSRRQLDISALKPGLSSSEIANMLYNWPTRCVLVDYRPIDPPRPQPSTKLSASTTGDSQVWVLDFDCCDAITMDIEGVEKAALSAHINDPYHPKPCTPESKDFELWEAFRKRYLATGAEIIKRKGLDEKLPRLFIDRLVALQGEQPRSEHRQFLRGPYCARHSQETGR